MIRVVDTQRATRKRARITTPLDLVARGSPTTVVVRRRQTMRQSEHRPYQNGVDLPREMEIAVLDRAAVGKGVAQRERYAATSARQLRLASGGDLQNERRARPPRSG
jgi:hypothetical protein